MLKITIQVQDKKGTENCIVKLINPKDLSKATENEKKVGAVVLNKIEKGLEELKENN